MVKKILGILLSIILIATVFPVSFVTANAAKLKGTSVTKLTSGTNYITVKWKKQTSKTTGYQVQRATNSKFTKGKKTVTVKSKKTTSKKLTGLASNTKYFVRVRTYKKASGKNQYSAWSKAKSIKTKITTKAKILKLLKGHYLYENAKTETTEVIEYKFNKNMTFVMSGKYINYYNNTVKTTSTQKGKYEVKGDEVIIHITGGTTLSGSKINPYDSIIYYTGGQNFVCHLSLSGNNVQGFKTYYRKNKVTDSNLKNYVKSFSSNYHVTFKQKKTFYSYLSMIDNYSFFEGKNCAYVYYNYLTLKSPYGTKNALVITTYASTYLEKSYVYIYNKSGKVIKYKSLPGALTKYTSNKNYLLTSCYYGSGMGDFTIMKYSSKSKNYIKNKQYSYEMSNRSSVTTQVNNATKSYKSFNYKKNRIK